jgi:Uma2 family endonuclease
LTASRDDGIVVVMPAPSLTIDEYLETPETMLPQELVYGFVREAAAPTPGHQAALVRFLVELLERVEPGGLGRVFPAPIDVVLDRQRHLVVQPDIVVMLGRRVALVTDRVWGPPDLVIEILSPRPRIGALDERLEWFARYGVRECWLYHQPGRELEVIEFTAGAIRHRQRCSGDARIVSGVLPQFTLSVEAILDGRA